MYYRESLAERAFREARHPIAHLYTEPLEDTVLLGNDQECTVALNYTAIAAGESGCKLLALALMSNHFHFILMEEAERVHLFWELLQGMMDGYLRRNGKIGVMKRIKASTTPISNLKQLRDEIAYVIRNSFVIRTDVHVFADPWSSGHLYFNPLLKKEGVPATELKGRGLREFLHSRTLTVPDSGIYVKDGCAQMWSFVDYTFVESVFDNARQFVHAVLKNVEAQVEISRRMGEKPFLSDEELLPLVLRYCQEKMQAKGPGSLPEEEKKKLALWIRREFQSSNKQLARLSGLRLQEVNKLFPLSAKT